MRLGAVEAAERFVEAHFPDCSVAILGGSVVRGEATGSSDLDIVILVDGLPGPYRESFDEMGWPIEAFVHNRESYRAFVEENCQRARPSMPKMVAEGIAVRDDGSVAAMKEEANRLLAEGPPAWEQRQIDGARYAITDCLDDLIGSADAAESLFIAGKLAVLLHEFVLRTNRRWIGDGKWVMRALRNYDPQLAERFARAFDWFYKKGDKHGILALADELLAPHGGRLFAGYSVGKPYEV